MKEQAYAKVKMHGKEYCMQVVARPLIGTKVLHALNLLSVTPGQKYIPTLRKLILSAAHNLAGENTMKVINNLIIKEVSVGRAMIARRIEFKGRGRVGSYNMSFCNVRCVVTWRDNGTKK